MEVEKGRKESAAAANPSVTSCGWPKWKKSKDGSFLSNLKEQFHDFVNTPVADHKLCFKNTIDEMADNFRREVNGLKGGEDSATVQSLPAEEKQ